MAPRYLTGHRREVIRAEELLAAARMGAVRRMAAAGTTEYQPEQEVKRSNRTVRDRSMQSLTVLL